MGLVAVSRLEAVECVDALPVCGAGRAFRQGFSTSSQARRIGATLDRVEVSVAPAETSGESAAEPAECAAGRGGHRAAFPVVVAGGECLVDGVAGEAAQGAGRDEPEPAGEGEGEPGDAAGDGAGRGAADRAFAFGAGQVAVDRPAGGAGESGTQRSSAPRPPAPRSTTGWASASRTRRRRRWRICKPNSVSANTVNVCGQGTRSFGAVPATPPHRSGPPRRRRTGPPR